MRLIDADALFDSLIFPNDQWKATFKELLDDEPTVDPDDFFDGMKNGDVFDSIIDVDNDCVEVYGKNGLMHFTFSQEWWNAPYKAEKEVIE